MQLLTGATGQIGHRLFLSLQADNHPVRVLGRRGVPGAEHIYADLGSVDADALQRACAGIDTLYHCAGYAHAFAALAGADAAPHRRINFEATRALLEAAGRAGVRRFIFVSSVKAVGEPGAACADETWAVPADTAYGQSKWAAEQAVLAAQQRYGMEVVNVRPAMVYGGGRGNLERMAAMIRRGYFPPLPETRNRRSVIYIDDVVDALRAVAGDGRANGNTYIIADPQAYSGRELYDAIRQALGQKPTTLSVPYPLLRAAAHLGDGLEALLGKRLPLDSEALDKLLGSSCYSPARIERELGWRAKTPLREGLKRMVGEGAESQAAP